MNQTKILEAIEEVLTPLYQTTVCKGGHDIDHVKRMIKIAEKICSVEVNLFLLKIAIWFHNLDRSTKFNGTEEQFIHELLIKFSISQDDIDLIVDAVEKHSRLNSNQDSNLLRYLKDCDMLDMGAIGILRIAESRNDLPIYLPSDFSEKPKDTTEKALKSKIHDIDRCLEWWDLGMIRTPKGRELGKRRFDFLRNFRKEIQIELEEIDIL